MAANNESGITGILMSLSGDIGDIKGGLGELKGRVEYSIRLHESCPARLGYNELVDKTNKITLHKKTSSDRISIPPFKLHGLAGKLIPWILFILVSGAASAGYILADPPSVVSGAPEK
jgi:hypothetical protein